MGRETLQTRAPISGIVVTFNEEKYLKTSLESLSFCDELIVVDLGSSDSSVEIARGAGAKVLFHERVPVVEKVREFAIRKARNDWIAFQDPDEVIPPVLGENLRRLVEANNGAAIIRGPIQFYFKEKPLTCCVWGAKSNSKIMLVHRDRINLRPLVHRGYEPLPGFEEVSIPRNGDNFVRHYWMSSYGQLFEKHRRYIKNEGESRYNSGERFSWSSMLVDTVRVIKLNLFDCRGLLGGPTGIFLSFFYGWYVLMSWLSLKNFQKNKS